MFKSKRRPLTLSQAEHGQLAGTLAWLWGNADFDLPAINRDAFIAGVGLHDRGYGYVDNISISDVSEPEWIDVTRTGFYMPWADAAADLIVKFHLRRLVSWTDSPAHNALLAEMDAVIAAQLGQHGLARQQFERIDCITRLCDMISFDFCFEEPVERELKVFLRNGSDEQLALRYSVRDGEIRVSPWPFAVESYSGYLVGYRLEGYPEALDPVIVPYRLSRSA